VIQAARQISEALSTSHQKSSSARAVAQTR
jgi:hypothetical protein